MTVLKFPEPDLPVLKPITQRCIKPLEGNDLDEYVRLIVDAERVDEDIASLERLLACKRATKVVIDDKVHQIVLKRLK